MTSSLAQLSAEFSVLLAAITHFTIAFFQHNKHSQRVTFSGQFLVWLGKCPLGSKLISGGVAIRMSWCAFFEKINSRGGTSIPDWRVVMKEIQLMLFTIQSNGTDDILQFVVHYDSEPVAFANCQTMQTYRCYLFKKHQLTVQKLVDQRQTLLLSLQ